MPNVSIAAERWSKMNTVGFCAMDVSPCDLHKVNNKCITVLKIYSLKTFFGLLISETDVLKFSSDIID